MSARSIRDSWQDYLTLTQQIKKELSKKNAGILTELLRQREELQKHLDNQVPEARLFIASEEGKIIYQEIAKTDKENILKFRFLMNDMQKCRKISSAYQPLSPKGNFSFEV